jgi:PII-like signaling protein
MKIPTEGQLLRIFIGESDRWHGKPLYEAIILRAREMGVAGATMLRGMMGYGAASRIHTAKILRLSEDLPIIVEIVDSKEKIESLLPMIDEMVQEGLVTLENVRVIKYRHSKTETK